MGFLERIFGTWSELSRFNKLPAEDRRLVFYSEGKQDWPHLGPIVLELASQGRRLAFVTSDRSNPGLTTGNPLIQGFHIGSGATRTVFFKSVDAKVVVMTLPDLETYHLKRSVHPAHYVYVFHSAVSSHMIYRKGAFDAYDTIFCVGPHHVREIRKTEEIYGLKAKALFEHGYGRLDRVLKTASERPPLVPSPGPAKRVLLAPSWGPCSFAEQPYGDELVRVILAAGHTVVLRLHPMTVRRLPKLAPSYTEKFAGKGNFRVETDMNEQESLQQSELMLSDWSGAALDYAFGTERPVLFVDTPAKINNSEFEKLGMAPLEAAVRTEIGAILLPENIAAAPEHIAKLTANPDAFRAKLREARERWIYNPGRSAAAGAAKIASLVEASGSHASAEAAR